MSGLEPNRSTVLICRGVLQRISNRDLAGGMEECEGERVEESKSLKVEEWEGILTRFGAGLLLRTEG